VDELEARRVLVIDDDELSREVLELLLSSEGYGVALASSGEEALAGLTEADACPDVVLMDLQMPGVSGEELVRRLRGACSGAVKVIAMSGSQARDANGADGFLLKPFSVEEFGEVLRTSGMSGFRERKALGAVDPAGAGVLDEGVFGSFRSMLGDGPLRELYGAGLDDASVQWERMRASYRAGDYVTLRKSAHTLKGSLGMLGARELERICLDLETGVVNDTYVTKLEQFPDAIERLRDMLNALGVSD
jgi:CheY-like chemotaxis protein